MRSPGFWVSVSQSPLHITKMTDSSNQQRLARLPFTLHVGWKKHGACTPSRLSQGGYIAFSKHCTVQRFSVFCLFSAGAVDPADLRFRRLRVRSTLSFMYHPTSVQTSVESTQQRLDCIQVWQITVGHLSGNLHITFSSILLLSEDDLNMLDTQP